MGEIEKQRYRDREIDWRNTKMERQKDRGEKQIDRADNKNPNKSWVAQLV